MDGPKKNTLLTLIFLAAIGTGYHFFRNPAPAGDVADGKILRPVPWNMRAPSSSECVSNDEGGTSKDMMANLEIPYRLDDSQADIIEHMGYTLSYNSDLRGPNWVAYELLASEVIGGNRQRIDAFEPDPLVKGRQAYDSDYRGSGYDRGHMAPSGDMKWSSQAMEECFYLSNVWPQNHNLNSGAWNDLEQQIRREAKYHGTVWIVCGPVFERNSPERIGGNHVAVPDSFFKAILTRKKDGSYACAAFLFPNKACTRNLTLYALTVNELEEKLDMDLFFNMDAKLQENVEDEMDLYGDWRIVDEILRN